eukprot:6160686-Pyramimonas_sp.AAC.1
MRGRASTLEHRKRGGLSTACQSFPKRSRSCLRRAWGVTDQAPEAAEGRGRPPSGGVPRDLVGPAGPLVDPIQEPTGPVITSLL